MSEVPAGSFVVAVALALAAACTPETSEQPSAAVVPQVGAPPAPVPRIASTDDWQDLVAQRPSAIVMRHGAVVIDLSREQSRKHLALTQQRVWRLGEEVDGRRAGVIVGRSGALDIPLDVLSPASNPGAGEVPGLAMAITVRSLAERQSMTVVVNDQPLAHLKVGPTWERRTLSLPPEALRAGDNRVRLHFRRTAPKDDVEVSAAVATIEVGTHARITSPPVDDEPEGVRVHPRADGGAELELRAGSALVYYVVPPRRGRLALDVRGRGSLAVRLSSSEDHVAGRAPTVLVEEPLRETGEHHELDLTAWGGMPVRIEIDVRGSDDDSHALIGSATLVARRSVPVDSRSRTLRDVIVLSIEGARADALKIGSPPPRLRNIEAFLAESLVFERAHALSPVAVPSHAGWLSSVTPPAHLTMRGTYIADAQTLLPEALARGGYFRSLITANTYLGAERGFTQGFDSVEALDEATGDDHARAVVAAARRKLGDRSGRWFADVNFDDPLAPWEPPREFLGELEIPRDGPIAHQTHLWANRVRVGKIVPTERVLAYVQRLYRGELQMIDDAFGDFMELLREQGRLEEAIVVLVGIHGQEFYEHGSAGGTDRALWEEHLRVPLAIRAPELLAPGAVSVPIDLLDLAPTIVDLIGMTAPESWQGTSLVPVIDDPQPPPRLVTAYLGDGSRMGLVGNYKLVVGPGLAERFFDLGTDAPEATDVLAEGGVALRIVRTALAWQLGYESRWRRARWGTGADLRPAFALDLGM